MCEVPNSMARIEDPEPCPGPDADKLGKKKEELREIRQKMWLEIKPLQKEVNRENQLSRNSLCICGSGRKWKKCCLFKHEGKTLMLEDLCRAYKELLIKERRKI